jgi:hypothetical protein
LITFVAQILSSNQNSKTQTLKLTLTLTLTLTLNLIFKYLQIGRMSDKNLLKKIILSVEKGLPFLIEFMGELVEPNLMGIISRVYIQRGKDSFILVDDEEIKVTLTPILTITLTPILT